MHKTNSRHSTYRLPLVTYHIVTLYWIQWNIVKSTKYIYLLRFRYRHRRMSTSRLVHTRHTSPLFVSFFIFLDWIQIVSPIKSSNRIYTISKHSSCQSTSRLVHTWQLSPLLSCGIKHLNWFQRLIIPSSKSSNSIYLAFTYNNWQFISWFVHSLFSFPFVCCQVQSLYCIQYIVSIVTSDEVKQISQRNYRKTTSFLTYLGTCPSPLARSQVEHLSIPHSLLFFFPSKNIDLLILSNTTKFGSIGRQRSNLFPIEWKKIKFNNIISLLIKSSNKIYSFPLSKKRSHVRHKRMTQRLFGINSRYIHMNLLCKLSTICLFTLFLSWLFIWWRSYSVYRYTRFLRLLRRRSLQLFFCTYFLTSMNWCHSCVYWHLPHRFYIWSIIFLQLVWNWVVVVV